MINSPTKVIISMEQAGRVQQITNNKCVCTAFNINTTLDEPARMTIELVGNNEDFVNEMFGSEYKPERKISELRVEDCSIEELMFAVRQKLDN